jgi:hypothetical protein
MDRWIGAGLFAAALLLLFLVIPAQINVPKIAIGGGSGGIFASPLFFPSLMAILIGVLAGSLFVRGHSRARSLADGEGFTFEPEQLVRVGGTVALLGLYLALLETVGYLLLTPVVLMALAAFLGFRRWVMLVTVSVGFTLVVYAGFRYGMKVFLPEGLLG